MPILPLVLALFSPEENPAPYNNQILSFCRSKLQFTVGRGECSDLADAALAKAGAAPRQQRELPQAGDYIWGNCIYMFEVKGGNRNEVFPSTGFSPIPGDIVQLRNIKAGRKTTHPDGSWTSYTLDYPHHTAVIASITEDKKTWKFYEQNTGNKRYVTEGQLVIPDINSGYLRVYRPKAPAN